MNQRKIEGAVLATSGGADPVRSAFDEELPLEDHERTRTVCPQEDSDV